MENIKHKGKAIAFNEDDATFYIVGDSLDRSFKSVDGAKKAIDRAIPDKPFVPFKVLEFEEIARHYFGSSSRIDAPTEVEVVGVVFRKGRRSWDDQVRFKVKAGGKESEIQPRYKRYYKVTDLETLKELREKANALYKQRASIDSELEKLEKTSKKMVVNLVTESEALGNKTPKHAI